MSLAYYVDREGPRAELVLLLVAPEAMAEANDTMIDRAQPSAPIVCFYYRPPPGVPQRPPLAMSAAFASGLRVRKSWNAGARIGSGETGAPPLAGGDSPKAGLGRSFRARVVFESWVDTGNSDEPNAWKVIAALPADANDLQGYGSLFAAEAARWRQDGEGRVIARVYNDDGAVARTMLFKAKAEGPYSGGGGSPFAGTVGKNLDNAMSTVRYKNFMPPEPLSFAGDGWQAPDRWT